MVSFDPTINLGTVLLAVTFIITVFKLNSDIVRMLTEMKTKVDAMWTIYMEDKHHE